LNFGWFYQGTVRIVVRRVSPVERPTAKARRAR
jgi:hypothetical protein